MSAPKTVFCDIDGTLLPHKGNIIANLYSLETLPNVAETIRQWDKLNYKIILTTGRQESTRQQTEKQLLELGIVYSQLIMGLPNGSRVLLNDKKPNGIDNTAYAVNLVRNEGLQHVDLHSRYVTVPDSCIFTKTDKPWGYEELVEINDKYVVKKLYMLKGHKSSIQFHKIKRETLTVLSGSLLISIGPSIEKLEAKLYGPSESVTIEPYTVHRMEAAENCLFMETSTNEIWDVVQVEAEHRYGAV